MTTIRPPTLAELVALIGDESDEDRRAALLDWYWAKAADERGALAAHWHREEYGWLVERQRRLDAMRSKPALGAFPSWRDKQEGR